MSSRDAARAREIVGIGLSDYPRAEHLHARQHHALAMTRALGDSGLGLADIDGYCVADQNLPDMVEYLGIEQRYVDGTFAGGPTFEHFVRHPSAAIRAGYADTILITYGSDQLSKRGRSRCRNCAGRNAQ